MSEIVLDSTLKTFFEYNAVELSRSIIVRKMRSILRIDILMKYSG